MDSNHDDDGFIIVKSKKKSAKNLAKYVKKSLLATEENACSDENIEIKTKTFEKIILDYKYKLEKCDNYLYWANFKMSLESVMSNQSKSLLIKSYGLGSLENNINTRYQFALLLLIVEELKACGCVVDSVEVYDPIFTNLDKALISKFNLKISNENDEARFCINNDGCSLFYMPHCGKALYNNLLYANWSYRALNSLCLIGNSFNTINSLEDSLSSKYKYLFASLTCASEIRLKNDCEHTNGFHDLTIIKFDSSLINFELDLGIPSYEHENEEIVFAK